MELSVIRVVSGDLVVPEKNKIPQPPIIPSYENLPKMDARTRALALEYLTPGCSRLLRSVSEKELVALRADIAKVPVAAAIRLTQRINNMELVVADEEEMRQVTVEALCALQTNRLLSIEQLATLHIRDAAIRDLYTHPTAFMRYEYVDEQGFLIKTVDYHDIDPKKLSPTQVVTEPFDSLSLPLAIDRTQLPAEMLQPVLQRFFHFTDTEWTLFCTKMSKAQRSEKHFCLLVAPQDGCWSGIVSKIQQIVELLRPVELVRKRNLKTPTLARVKHMVVPSFTMLQTMLDVKATTLGRRRIQLVPTYGAVEPEDYATQKLLGRIPIGLYLPEACEDCRYNRSNRAFKGRIDHWPHEGPFAFLLHDIYHALMWLLSSDQVTDALPRLISIAEANPHIDRFGSKLTSQLLVEGEFDRWFPPNVNTIDDNEQDHQIFGDLFYVHLLARMQPELKELMIADMALHADEWQENFGCGRDDLRSDDRPLYDKHLPKRKGR